VLCSDDAIRQIEQDAEVERVDAALGIPDLRSPGVVPKLFSTGEWVHGRHEQMAVYYVVSDTGLPLLCLGRVQRFRTGVRGNKQTQKRPEQYQLIGQAWAYNLADRTHVSALFTALRTLKVFYHHNERLVRDGLVQVPVAESKSCPSLDKVELSRVELSTPYMFGPDDKEPDRVEQVLYAGRSWNPLRGRECWQIYLALDGWVDGRLQQVRFHDGPLRVHLRHETIPELISTVLGCLDLVHELYVRRGSKKHRDLIWNDAEYQYWRQAELVDLASPGCSYDPSWLKPATSRFYQQPSFSTTGSMTGDLAWRYNGSYYERLRAFEAGTLRWLPTWSVPRSVALRDLSVLQCRHAAYRALVAALLATYLHEALRPPRRGCRHGWAGGSVSVGQPVEVALRSQRGGCGPHGARAPPSACLSA
jgi:hypothetical protein